MATGDVQGSVERLRSELRHIRYPADLDCTGAKLGVAAAFLPVLNYVLLKFSRHVAHQLVSAGYELQGKTDARFSEAAFKIFRDKFGLRPVLTAPQFLEQGFAERKLMLVSDVIAYCKSFHNAAVRRARLAAASAPTKLPRAPQHPRVQRHSDAVPGAETASASAAAALQARLCPSSAQLAHMDQSQNIDPNPWGPSAHALRAVSMRSVHQQDSHGMAAVSLHGPYDRLSQSAGHLPSQQQHASGAQYQSRAQGEAGIMPAATQAWVVNPAFGSESPMPSPEKQPRSQGPPMPHPSIYSTAEEQAAQARQHGERQAHTLEARITLLEGRLSFVEGELAAERQHSAAAAQAGDSGGAQRSAEVAVCLSPSAAKARQDKAAAGLAAPHAVSKPPMTTPHRCMDVEASPTRSTAGTPRYRPGNGGVSRQLGLSVLAQQSPARSMRAPAVPASPASSMHSYKSTSELIESIQNRYLEAQSFLKSYKL
ncbi:MAG: centrosomal of 44 kDa [Trebouxia sp. A1-2]|nr:MAG: centrosomal of 44 kDa [Trebouxia sp. A1-2]